MKMLKWGEQKKQEPFSVGDRIISGEFGIGAVKEINPDPKYQLGVVFHGRKGTYYYNMDGTVKGMVPLPLNDYRHVRHFE